MQMNPSDPEYLNAGERSCMCDLSQALCQLSQCQVQRPLLAELRNLVPKNKDSDLLRIWRRGKQRGVFVHD